MNKNVLHKQKPAFHLQYSRYTSVGVELPVKIAVRRFPYTFVRLANTFLRLKGPFGPILFNYYRPIVPHSRRALTRDKEWLSMGDACLLMALVISRHDNQPSHDKKRSWVQNELRGSTTTTTKISNLLSTTYLAIKIAKVTVFPHDVVVL
jgi:hypothetical protein